MLGKLLLPGRTQLLSLSTIKQRLRMEPLVCGLNGRGMSEETSRLTQGCPRVSCTASCPAQLHKVSSVWPHIFVQI